ncbi:MAG TPA: 2'-5' RNA ligase family protein [Trebonia sp.]
MMQMSDHWRWRRGWRPGRRKYTWHVTFRDSPTVRKLAGQAQGFLAGLPGLDLVPDEWLHLTTQGIAFADEVTDAELDAIVGAARTRLTAIEPVEVTVGPARVAGEAVLCPVAPARELTPARDALRDAIASVRGSGRVPGAEEWHPHVSVAYSNTTGPADAFEAALSDADSAATTTVTAVDLIRLGRDRHVYEWETYATVPLGQGAQDSDEAALSAPGS